MTYYLRKSVHFARLRAKFERLACRDLNVERSTRDIQSHPRSDMYLEPEGRVKIDHQVYVIAFDIATGP